MKATTCMARVYDLEEDCVQMNTLDKKNKFGNHGGPGGEPFSSGNASLRPRPC